MTAIEDLCAETVSRSRLSVWEMRVAAETGELWLDQGPPSRLLIGQTPESAAIAAGADILGPIGRVAPDGRPLDLARDRVKAVLGFDLSVAQRNRERHSRDLHVRNATLLAPAKGSIVTAPPRAQRVITRCAKLPAARTLGGLDFWYGLHSNEHVANNGFLVVEGSGSVIWRSAKTPGRWVSMRPTKPAWMIFPQVELEWDSGNGEPSYWLGHALQQAGLLAVDKQALKRARRDITPNEYDALSKLL